MFLRTLNRLTGRKIPVQALTAVFVAALLLVQSSFAAAEQADPTYDLPKGSEVAVARLLELRPDIPIISVYPISVEGMFGIDLPGGTTLFATQDGKHLFAGELFAWARNWSAFRSSVAVASVLS